MATPNPGPVFAASHGSGKEEKNLETGEVEESMSSRCKQHPLFQNQRQGLGPGTSEQEPQEDASYYLPHGSSNPQATPGTVVPTHRLLQPKPDLAYT